MSDIIIPGVTSKINSEKIIEGLMKVERIPLDRLEKQNEENREKKQIWQDLNRKLAVFRDSSRKLYSFQNPFEDKTVISSDQSIISASAGRGAAIENRELKILETAKADKFASGLMDRNKKIDAGVYTFASGDKKITLNYRGGTIRDFAEHINKNSNKLFRASTINVDSNNIYFLIESTRTGQNNSIAFEDKALDFALESELIGRSSSGAQNITPGPDNIKQWTGRLDPAGYQIDGNSLTLKPSAELQVQISPPAAPNDNFIIELEVKIKNLSESDIQSTAASEPQGPSMVDPGKLEYEDITILNNPFELPLPEKKLPEEPEIITDMSVIFLTAGNSVRKTNDLSDTESIQKIQIPMSELGGPLSAVNFRNRNTYKEITISNIRIYNPDARGDYVPVNAVTTASDARIEIDGIQVTRESNSVDDLIPDVTLTLLSAGTQNVELNIKPDAEKIKNNLIEFVGYYNNLQAEIQILTRTNANIVDEIEYFTDDERKAARERLGILQGEISLTQLRDRLQRIMTNNYPLGDESLFTMLAQIGISTNSGTPGTGISESRLRGYLEINEEKLDSVIEEGGQNLKNLFGFDRDNDLVVDSGIAFETDRFIRAYSDSGGVIPAKIVTIDRSISRTDTDIVSYNRRLERIEQDLKRKYGMMEGALQDLESSSRAIQNMNNSNNSR